LLLLLQIRTQPHLGCCLAAATAAASAICMHLCTNSATPYTSVLRLIYKISASVTTMLKQRWHMMLSSGTRVHEFSPCFGSICSCLCLVRPVNWTQVRFCLQTLVPLVCNTKPHSCVAAGGTFMSYRHDLLALIQTKAGF
jgi:hypothetical protein